MENKNKEIEQNNYDVDDIARMCDVAIILAPYNIPVDDLHDFFHNHVKVIYDEWCSGKVEFMDFEEEGYVSAYASRVAVQRYLNKF